MSRCTRCGKERIVNSTYKQKVGNSTVTYTVTVCPDPECQKIINKNLKQEAQKRAAINKESKTRELQRAAAKLKAKKANMASK